MHEPQYEWAMTSGQHPVHITYAVRGETYVCPVCNGRMIAKLGDIKQHHFAHETIQICSPERVPDRRKILAGGNCKSVLVATLIEHDVALPALPADHTANLLHEVNAPKPITKHDGTHSDIALLDHSGKVLAAILLDMPSKET
jgi:hypothetical protein